MLRLLSLSGSLFFAFSHTNTLSHSIFIHSFFLFLKSVDWPETRGFKRLGSLLKGGTIGMCHQGQLIYPCNSSVGQASVIVKGERCLPQSLLDGTTSGLFMAPFFSSLSPKVRCCLLGGYMTSQLGLSVQQLLSTSLSCLFPDVPQLRGPLL